MIVFKGGCIILFKKGFLPLILVTVFSFGCALEQNIDKKRFDLGNSLSVKKCLREFPKTIEKYFKSEVKKKELIGSWDCVIDTTQLFLNHVKGEERNRYSKEEIRKFLNENLLRKKPVTEELFNSIMDLKKLFLGGSVDYITKKEFVVARRYIEFLKEQSLGLMSYVDVYFKNCSGSKCNFSEQHIKDAQSHFEIFSKRFNAAFSTSRSEYSFEKFKILLEKLEEDYEVNLEKILNTLPFIQSLKLVLTSGSQDILLPHEWNQFFEFLVSTSSIWIDYKHRFKSIEEVQSIHVLNDIISNIFKTLENSLKYHKNAIIPNEYIESLIEETLKIFNLSSPIPEENINKTWRAFSRYILYPKNRTPKKGVNIKALDYIKSEYRDWHTYQIFLYENIDNVCKLSLNLELQNTLSCKLPSLLDYEGRLYVGSKKRTYDPKSIFYLNTKRALVRLLFRSYSSSPDFLKSLTLAELKRALKDFDFLLGNFIPDPEQGEENEFHQSIDGLFLILNLFLPQSNGNISLDFSETINAISYFLGTKRSVDIIFEVAEEVCPEKFDKDCFIRILLDQTEHIFSNFPDFLNYLNILPFEKDFNFLNAEEDIEAMSKLSYSRKVSKFGVFIEDFSEEKYFKISKQAVFAPLVAALKAKDKKTLLKSQVFSSLSLLYFTEVYFGLFDENVSYHIEKDETLASFYRFDKFLTTYLRENQKERYNKYGPPFVKSIFTYLIYKGKAPSFSTYFYFKKKWLTHDLDEERKDWNKIQSGREIVFKALISLI